MESSDGRIIIDGCTKIVISNRIVFKQGVKCDKSIDLGRDSILVIDAVTSRPLATIRPIAGMRAPALALAPVNGQAATLRVLEPAASDPMVDAAAEGSHWGPLTETQRELLTRIWTNHPTWNAGQVANEFHLNTKRAVKVSTIEKYRPPTRPTIEEVEQRVKATK